MTKHPIFLNSYEIYDYQKTLPTVDEQIEYHKYIIAVYKEADKHETDDDLKKYIDKYELSEKILHIEKEYPLVNTDRFLNYNEHILISPNFKNIHEKLNILIGPLEHELGKLNLYKITVCDNFELVFYQNDIDYYFVMFNNNSKSLKWITRLNRKLDTIYMMFSDDMLEKVMEKYELENNFPRNDKLEWKKVNGITYTVSIYQKFRDYLNLHFLPLLRKEQESLEMIVAVEDTKYYLEKGITSEDRIFPEWSYKYDKAKEYSDKALPNLQLKMQYFKFLISRYQISKSKIPSIDLGSDLVKLENEFDYLKCKYDLERDTLLNTPLEKSEKPNVHVKKRNENGALIKHYLETAIGLHAVPSLKDLESPNMGSSFWSKKLKVDLFLIELLNRINRKLESKRINKMTVELFLDLRDDVNSRIDSICKKDRNSTGSKNKNSNSLDERFSEDSEENSYY